MIKFLSYLIAMVLGFGIGGGLGLWLCEIMTRRRILDKNNRDFWEIAFCFLFGAPGLAASIYIVSMIFGD
jgi:hypothetical protein